MIKNRDKKSYIFWIGVLVVMIAGAIWGSTWLYGQAKERLVIREELTKELNEQIAQKEQLQLQIEELTTQNEQLQIQTEELNEEIEKLREEGAEAIEVEKEEAEQKVAYLTFDDGPSENTTPILDLLKANHVKATFFVLGKKGKGDLYRRIVEEGHTIAVHSNTHDYAKIYQSVEAFMEDVNTLRDFIEEETGVKPTIFRFPGGSNNLVSHRYGGADIMDKIIPEVEAAGYTYFDWNVDSQDASKSHQDKDVIVNAVLTQAKYMDNAVVLMHDAPAKKTTVEALPEILQGLKEQGFIFKPLTEDSEPVRFR